MCIVKEIYVVDVHLKRLTDAILLITYSISAHKSKML